MRSIDKIFLSETTGFNTIPPTAFDEASTHASLVGTLDLNKRKFSFSRYCNQNFISSKLRVNNISCFDDTFLSHE